MPKKIGGGDHYNFILFLIMFYVSLGELRITL
jgi:hypothetical protein